MATPTKQRNKIISYCNYADLKAVVLDVEPNEVRAAYGLPARYGNCLKCKAPLPYRRKYFCSPKCRYEYYRIKVECPTCGKLFERLASDVIYQLNTVQKATNKPVQRFFCSNQCQGKWTAENYGFIAHPENIGLGGRKRKWDCEQIEELIRASFTVTEIMKALNMPRGSRTVIYNTIYDRNLSYIFCRGERSKYYEEILKLRQEGMPYKRISEKLEIPLGTVGSIVRREKLKHSK